MNARKPNSDLSGMTAIQRLSALQVCRTSRAAIEAFRDLVVADCTKALATIERVEHWLATNKKRPQWIDDYYWANGIANEIGPEPDKEAIADAEALMEREYDYRFDTLHMAIYLVMGHASGLRQEPLDVSIAELRKHAEPGTFWTDSSIADDVTRAIDASLGAGPQYKQESEARS